VSVDTGRAGADRRLDNPVWHALTSRDARLAESRSGAWRYRPDVSVFYGVDRLDGDAWGGLAELAGSNRGVVLVGHEIDRPPPGWIRQETLLAHQMVLTQMVLTGLPAESSRPPEQRLAPIRPLDADDVPRMLELVDATRPGPFRARTHELGPYVGVFQDGRLVAMAGERMHLPGFTEISAVCTHPDVRRRGLGAALTRQVATAIVERGETPFLHVAGSNDSARRLYQQLGFATRRSVTVEILRSPRSGDGDPT
jgi:ribosomal protein S18 acetylase RimI-like enzyme